jgi:hypothetical protein
MDADTQSLDSEIAAFSKWVSPHRPDPNAEDTETSIRKEPQPPGSNDELVVEYMTNFLHQRKKWLVPETDYCPYLLAFVPRLCPIHNVSGTICIHSLTNTLRPENPCRSAKESTKRSRLYASRTLVGTGR